MSRARDKAMDEDPPPAPERRQPASLDQVPARSGAARCPPGRAPAVDILCPACGIEMHPEHAHYRCPQCGYRDSCCF
jgi:hypothetical protein